MPDPNSPLNEQHLQQLNNALDQARLADIQIQMAKRAGIPGIEQLEQQNNDNISKLRTIKQVYFAGQ